MAETIWILDDDAELGALLLSQFAQRGWSARHLSHPRELELALDQSQPDLLVLDELLPEQRGTDVLARLRRGLPHLPVLMLSALGGPRDRVAGLEAGANDYLGKPFLFRELQLRVEQLLKPAQISRLGAQAWQLGELQFQPQGRRLFLEDLQGFQQQLLSRMPEQHRPGKRKPGPNPFLYKVVIFVPEWGEVPRQK